MQRISGRDVEVRLSNGQRLLIESASLNVEDGVTAVSDQGYPAGWVYGAVKGDGEVEINTEDLNTLLGDAATAGSWEEMAPVDLTFFGKAGTLELLVEVFGIKLRMPGLDLDGKGGDKITHKIPFVVGSPDFVKFNGTPLARRRP